MCIRDSPGPGLAIRIIGELDERKVSILQDADYIFREEIAKAGMDRDIHQYFAVLTNAKMCIRDRYC